MVWCKGGTTLALGLGAAACFAANGVPISRDVYNDLVFYFKYASSAYAPICPEPNGQSLVQPFKNLLTQTQGFVARDDMRKEIVVALRGSFSLADVVLDSAVLLAPLDSPGVAAPWGTRVHAGFLTGWNSVAPQVLSAVRRQLVRYPSYGLVASGHSLGGALASLAAVSLRANFLSSNVSLYTYGQPRTGNAVFAFWVNSELGDRVFRVVHTYDGVPTVIPAGMFPRLDAQPGALSTLDVGYRHHGVEYWQDPDPASEGTTRRCASHGEDPRCSTSIGSTGVNAAHLAYFGVLAITPFCFAGAVNA